MLTYLNASRSNPQLLCYVTYRLPNYDWAIMINCLDHLISTYYFRRRAVSIPRRTLYRNVSYAFATLIRILIKLFKLMKYRQSTLSKLVELSFNTFNTTI